jgi:hypothetical protein
MILKIFGASFILLIIDAVFIFLDYCLGNTFLVRFLREQSLQIMGVLLGLNLTAATVLISQMTNIEMHKEKLLFKSSRNEIKHNLFFMIGLFFINFTIIVFLPDCVCVFPETKCLIKYFLIAVSLDTFLLSFYCLYEIIMASFEITEKIID